MLIKYLDENGVRKIVKEVTKRTTSVYTVKGSAIYADDAYLANPVKEAAITSKGLWQLKDGAYTKVSTFVVGDVYSIQNPFITDATFHEGAGLQVDTGMNIVVLESDPAVKFDTLGDITNLDAYQKKVLEDEIVLYDAPLGSSTGAALEEENLYKQFKMPDGTVKRIERNADGTGFEARTLTDSNTTVEGVLTYIESIMPNTPITDAEIDAIFAEVAAGL